MSTAVDDLLAFWRARLDRAEATARAAPELDYRPDLSALREVAADRAILALYERAVAAPESISGLVRGQDDGYRQACLDIIRLRASVYSDHPSYRRKWKP